MDLSVIREPTQGQMKTQNDRKVFADRFMIEKEKEINIWRLKYLH